MKNTLVAVISALSILFPATAFSGGYHSHGHGHRHHRYFHSPPAHHWVAPAIIGGIVGYGLSRPLVVEQPVIVQQPVVVQSPTIASPAPILSTDNNNQVTYKGVVYHLRIEIIDEREQAVLVPVK